MYLALVLLLATGCVAHFGVPFNGHPKGFIGHNRIYKKYQWLLFENRFRHIVQCPATTRFHLNFSKIAICF